MFIRVVTMSRLRKKRPEFDIEKKPGRLVAASLRPPVAQFLDVSIWQTTYAKFEIGTSWRKKRKKRRNGSRVECRFVRDPSKNFSQIYSDLLRFGQIYSDVAWPDD